MIEDIPEFEYPFRALTGNSAFPWQRELYRQFATENIPSSCNLPTGLGKTSVIAIWLIALAKHPTKMPRRLVYVVNRRTVVDQTTDEAERLRKNLAERQELKELRDQLGELAISTLRGQFADNREWSADPSRPAVICGTVDMIGSRLLFSGYGVGFKGKPLHAGFLGQDALLVHDEAHLEPAFQELLIAIEREQGEGERSEKLPWPKLRVMELSATSRGKGEPFKLSDKDYTDPVVMKRIGAKKAIHLHENNDDKRLADILTELALQHKDSRRAVLIFVRKVEDVEKIVKKLPRNSYEQLTGTLRGLERDDLVTKPIFQRFLPESNRDKDVAAAEGSVYLVCTSAGEVGVNISADHLVCDLSTFDSMAQRFGRVNRFGDRDDTRIDIVHPSTFGKDGKIEELDLRRQKTLSLLKELNGGASPIALGKLDPDSRLAAFAPPPAILPATDILFDAWALTTIREKLPGRPPVEPYLRGVREWEPPETQVAWREDVEIITGELLGRYKPEDLLEDFPLKPHELMRDRTYRVIAQLESLAQRIAQPESLFAWVIDDDGTVAVHTVSKLVAKNAQDKHVVNLAGRTILLPPSAGGLLYGMLNGVSESANDVSCLDKDGNQQRWRGWDDEPPPDGMRLVRPPLDTKSDVDENEADEPANKRYWQWYTQPRSADDDLSKTTAKPIKWVDHTNDVTTHATRFGNILFKDNPALHTALVVAAQFHDLGKKREVWQRSIGNPNPADSYAKSGRDPSTGKLWRPRDICPDYRHEFGSLLDVLLGNNSTPPKEFTKLSDDMQDLVLHLIAAHHGYARPHFPPQNSFDPEHNHNHAGSLAIETPRRFAKLQRKYGRWGLAYLESLLRAADWAASAKPSEVVP